MGNDRGSVLEDIAPYPDEKEHLNSYTRVIPDTAFGRNLKSDRDQSAI